MAKINSKLIEDYMKENNLTAGHFAEKCGVSTYIIKKMLSGKCPKTPSPLIKVCLLTEIKADDLLVF